MHKHRLSRIIDADRMIYMIINGVFVLPNQNLDSGWIQ